MMPKKTYVAGHDQNHDAQLELLETAILARAEKLASRYLEQGERRRDQVLSESSQRLQLREQREVLFAKNLAGRTYRRQVQASELRMHKQADLLRWDLVQAVIREMHSVAAIYAEQDQGYPELLIKLIGKAASHLKPQELLVEVNARDYQRLAPEWPGINERQAPDKKLVLLEEPIQCIGGAVISSADRRQRVDNTLEGRAERQEQQLHALIMERLFASVPDMEALFKG